MDSRQNYIHVQYYQTKIGELILGSFKSKLCLLDYRYRKTRISIDNRLKKGLNAEFVEEDDNVIRKTKQQIEEYLDGKRQEFDIPILMLGTDFQKAVWRVLLEVKYGETLTYLELSRRINNENAIRAVAFAIGANAISLIIPCHRIIGSKGELVGYSGGLQVKKMLLKLENTVFNSQLEITFS